MKNITAIGFDLFNTLVTAEPNVLDRAFPRLQKSMEQDGLFPDSKAFRSAYYDAAIEMVTEAIKSGVETHNRFWISKALATQGYEVTPDDPRIARAVDAYFSTFYDSCRRIPGTRNMLETLKGQYQLGLLSNFTHWPAAEEIIYRLDLRDYFDVLLISGKLGYRKPHFRVFQELLNGLGRPETEVLYVGDDVNADIKGASQAGITPLWFTYVRDEKPPIPSAMVPNAADEPDETVLRASSWEEFLSILNRPWRTTNA